MTDEEIVGWADAHSIGGPYSCSAEEMQRLLDLAKHVQEGGTICEIGVLYGRSASIYILESIRRWPRPLFIELIDSWVLNEGDARPTFERMTRELASEVTKGGGGYYYSHWMPSQEAAKEIGLIDLLHIDGDHVGGVWDDCRLYLPKLKIGGVVAVHDYGDMEVYPEVTKAVHHHISGSGWKVLPIVGRLFSAMRIG
jgi:hypothetical protein